jgi:hypothetical protein
VDHVADKFCAVLQRYGAVEAPSTRFKDLVDLVAIVITMPVDGEEQTIALRSEATRRGLSLPESFDVPGRGFWGRGYKAKARRSTLPTAHALEDALAIVRGFVDPVMRAEAAGSWSPGAWTWEME